MNQTSLFHKIIVSYTVSIDSRLHRCKYVDIAFTDISRSAFIPRRESSYCKLSICVLLTI